MQSVAKFVTKAYLVSGSFEHLKEVSKGRVEILDFRVNIQMLNITYTLFMNKKNSWGDLRYLCQCCAGFARHYSYWRTDISKHSVGLCWKAENLPLQGLFAR